MLKVLKTCQLPMWTKFIITCLENEDLAVKAEPKQRLWHYRRLASGTDHFFDPWATVPGTFDSLWFNDSLSRPFDTPVRWLISLFALVPVSRWNPMPGHVLKQPVMRSNIAYTKKVTEDQSILNITSDPAPLRKTIEIPTKQYVLVPSLPKYWSLTSSFEKNYGKGPADWTQ